MVDEVECLLKLGSLPYHGIVHLQSDTYSVCSSINNEEDSETDGKRSAETSTTMTLLGKRSRRLLSQKTVKILEGAALTVAIVSVLCLFSLPVVLYKVEYAKAHQNTTNSGNASSSSDFTCNASSWTANSSSQCLGENYVGGACSDSLLSWQACAGLSAEMPVRVDVAEGSQEQLNDDMSSLITALDNMSSSKECKEVAIPFACLFLFPLCDSNGVKYIPSHDLCVNISTGICQQEWIVAISSVYGNMLPKCGDLPDVPAILNCSEGFIQNGSVCIPNCYKLDTGTKAFHTFFVISAAIFGLCVSILLLFASYVRRKIMWGFPYVFLIYVTTDYCILTAFLLVTLLDRGLFCHSINAIDAINNPTMFCMINGAVAHYFIINMTYFWFFHVCSTFYKVMFPHMAKRTESKQGFIHATLVIVAIILPLPAVIVVLTNSEYQYTIPSSFPVYICLSKSVDYVIFYSSILVLNLLLAAGICLFIPMFWVVHKYRKTVLHLHTNMRKKWRVGTIEQKLLFTLFFFVILGVVVLVNSALELAETDNISLTTKQYFACEAQGPTPGTCNTYIKELHRYSFNILGAVAYTLIGLFPLAILIFIIDWNTTWKKLKNFLQARKPHASHTYACEAFSTFSPAPSTSINNGGPN